MSLDRVGQRIVVRVGGENRIGFIIDLTKRIAVYLDTKVGSIQLKEEKKTVGVNLPELEDGDFVSVEPPRSILSF